MGIIQGGTVIEGAFSRLSAFNLGAPAVQDTDTVLASTALTDEAQTITENITDPDICRGVCITGTEAGQDKDVVINGTNYYGESISETITSSGSSTVYGTKAFKTITSIVLPAYNNLGDDIAVGYGKILGLPYMLTDADKVVLALLNKAVVAPTITVDADEVEKNTVDISSGTYNGTKEVVVLLQMEI